MNRLRMRILPVVILLCAAFVLSGCSSHGEGQYTLYYTNSNATILMEYTYEPKQTGVQALVVELYNQMRDVSISNAYSVIPTGVECEKVTQDGDIVNIYVSGNIDKTTNNERLVFMSSLTKAISAIPDVSGVRILHNEENVTDGMGNYIDVLKPNNFINNANDNGDDYIDNTVTLYYADADKDALVKTVEDVTYRSTTPIERVVVESIIEGPSDKNLNPTVSDKLILLNISVQAGIAYVNLSQEFITDPVTSFDKVAIYSIVNSLCELPNINSVQISINGDTAASMPKGTSLASSFSFNSELVIR